MVTVSQMTVVSASTGIGTSVAHWPGTSPHSWRRNRTLFSVSHIPSMSGDTRVTYEGNSSRLDCPSTARKVVCAICEVASAKSKTRSIAACASRT